jgi:F-type H+-transporting ATPase subunit gamma
MSRRRQVEERLRALCDIEDVLGAMKNLALMETRKLTRFLATQRRVVESIDAALADLLAFHPELRAGTFGVREAHLLLGSERGFCGDFNERIVTAADLEIPREGAASCVAVGFKLWNRLGDDPRVAARVPGATVAEEVQAVLARALGALAGLGDGPGPLRVSVIHHVADQRTPRVERLDPFAGAGDEPAGRCRPVLNLAPAEVLRDLVRHSLDAHLHELFYASLAAENQRRLEHMESALDRVAGESARLRLRRNVLRQEEITEEIEVILLTADALKAP